MAIELIDEDESFEFMLPGTESEHGPSVLILRRLTTDEQKEIFKKHTTTKFQKGQRFQDTDGAGVITDSLMIGIVGWRNVRNKTTREEVPFSPELTKAIPRSDRERIFAIICDVPEMMDGVDPFESTFQTSGDSSKSEKQPPISHVQRVAESP